MKRSLLAFCLYRLFKPSLQYWELFFEQTYQLLFFSLQLSRRNKFEHIQTPMRTNPCTFIMAMLFFMASMPLFANNGEPTPERPPNGGFEVDIIKLRLEMMDCPVKAEYNSDVAAYLRSFLTYGYKGTERMLTEGKMYFPIFFTDLLISPVVPCQLFQIRRKNGWVRITLDGGPGARV